jgi:hypothetical protein
MIRIYHEDEKSIGFVFLLFENLKSVVDYREFKTESSKINYLNNTRKDLIIYNLEYFVKKTGDRKLELDKTAQERLIKFINFSIENEDKKKEFFTYVSRMDKHMKTLAENEKREDVKQELRAIRHFVVDEAANALDTY